MTLDIVPILRVSGPRVKHILLHRHTYSVEKERERNGGKEEKVALTILFRRLICVPSGFFFVGGIDIEGGAGRLHHLTALGTTGVKTRPLEDSATWGGQG